MELIQMCATSHGDQIRGEALPSWPDWMPYMPFDKMAEYCMDFRLQSEALPRRENRIYYDGAKMVLDVTEGDERTVKRLKHKLESLMEPVGARPHLLERKLYLGKNIPINGTAHQSGTCRFGTNPQGKAFFEKRCKNFSQAFAS